jgi:hypothetical protein
MIGGPRRDRERFPCLKEQIGEDPARYLDVDRIDDLQLARVRIRGIDFLATLRAWRAVERQLGPRPKVLEWLDEREAKLERIGNRDERLADADIEGRREATPSTASTVVWSDRDGGERTTNSVDADRYRAATAGGDDA